MQIFDFRHVLVNVVKSKKQLSNHVIIIKYSRKYGYDIEKQANILNWTTFVILLIRALKEFQNFGKETLQLSIT